MRKALTVYKASAGSGKTFALAVQYIKLVVRDPQSYRTILAVTFTNKATEEMKMRILSQLYGIWKQLPDSIPYHNEVCKALDATPQFVSERAGIALSLLLHNYNHFRVMTIDTFFQSVLRNLAHELDLTANLRIGLNDVQVEEMAVDQMIEGLKKTDIVLQWILKYIMENISDDRSWNVIGQIKQFGKTIFRDYYREISKQLDEKLKEDYFFEHYTRTLRSVSQAAKERMQNMADTFFDTLEAEGLTIEDLAYGKTGVAGFFTKIQNGIFDESIVGTRVCDCIGQPEKWYKKNHPRRELIHNLADGQLGSLLRQAIEERPRQWCLYQSAMLTLRHLNQVRLLSSIENKVRTLNEEANRFLLSDTQKLLNSLISESDSPFIFEKIGTQLEHVMIDEFQDTSTVQWQNFRVLLLETMSHAGSENLIVGDVKQSIYRWRSGDWRLLNDIEQQFPHELLQTEVLKVNRRSERHIVEFNNAFFNEAARLEFERLEGQAEAEQLQRAYQDVQQDIPNDKPADGFVSVELITGEVYQEQTLTHIVDNICDLCSMGIPQNKIAILVRTNSLIPLIAKYFAEHKPEISIISDEAFRLDASRSVNIIIQALRIINNPNDQLATAFLKKSGYDTSTLQQRAASVPLYELVEQLFADFHLDYLDDQSAYICAFFDQLRQYTIDNPATIEDFLHQWESDICSKNIQSDLTDGIRIISIHKSKGLEFDYVVCPFCDWQLEKNGNVLWCRPAEQPFNDLPLVPIDYSQKGMVGTIYEGDYHHEHLQNVVDNLNLLYVAFTRARRGLMVIGKREAHNSRSELIEQVLPALKIGMLTGIEDKEQPLTYKYGELTRPMESDNPVRASSNPFLIPSSPLSVSVTTHTTKAEFRQSNKSREFISDDDEQATTTNYIQLGSVLHRVFSTIRTTSDIDNALHDLESEGIIYDNELTLDRITTMLHRRLEHPKVAEWFSDGWTLFNECTILSIENGEVIERRPDRVMTNGTRWIIVDFKFGRPQPEYHDQVRQYMHLLMAMGHTHISGFLWYVYSNKIEEVEA